MPNRIPLDPELPSTFDSTSNEKRPRAQLDAWWDRPYGITRADGRIDATCLNGGAHDRSTYLGTADNYDAACALAEAEQATWLKHRERPILHIAADCFAVVRDAQRPDEERTKLATFPSAAAAADYMRAHYPEAPAEE